MKLKYTILYVENVSTTLEFYKNAFGFSISFMHEAGDYGELNTGETTLSFSSLKLMSELGKKPAKATLSAPVFEIAFETANVTQCLQKAIAAGATLVQDIKEEPWGQTTSYVSDINGFLIEICSPVTTQASSAVP
ncbi:MAG: VOC family protein [Granulosicoccus sp.]